MFAEAPAASLVARKACCCRGVALLGLGLGISIVTASLVARSITEPIAQLTADSARLSGGDTSVEFKAASRRDEIGQVAGAIARFQMRDCATGIQKNFAQEVAARDATNRNMERAVEDFRGTSTELLAMVGNNAAILKQTASALTGIAARRHAGCVSHLGIRADGGQRAGPLATAAEQLTSSIQKIGRQIDLSNSTVRTAGVVARRFPKARSKAWPKLRKASLRWWI